MALENIKQMTRPLSKEKEVASGPDPNDMSGWYEMYDDLKSRDELPDWMNSFELFMENLDVLDISPMDFTKRKTKQPEGIMQLASHTGNDVMKSAMIWMAGLPGPDGNPIGMDEVIRQLNIGETDMNGLVNAYMDAKAESN